MLTGSAAVAGSISVNVIKHCENKLSVRAAGENCPITRLQQRYEYGSGDGPRARLLAATCTTTEVPAHHTQTYVLLTPSPVEPGAVVPPDAVPDNTRKSIWDSPKLSVCSCGISGRLANLNDAC